MTLLLAALILAQPAATDFNQFFKEFAHKRDAIQTVQADFVQTVITPDETYDKKGNIVFVQPRKLLFHYDDPPQSMLIENKTIYDYDVQVKQLNVQQVENLREAEALFLAFENNPDRLRELYDVEVLDAPEDGQEGCHGREIVLRPKPVDGEEPLFKRTTLYLREQDFLPCRIHVKSNEDTEFYIDIKNYKINEKMAPDAMSFTVPEGVSVVFDDTLVQVIGAGGAHIPKDLPISKLQKEAKRIDATKAPDDGKTGDSEAP